MGFAVLMLTYGSATFGANSGDIAIFPNHFFGKKYTKKRRHWILKRNIQSSLGICYI